MLYQRAGVVTEESPPISAPDDIDPKGDSSVPRHRMGRCCGAVRSAPKPGRPKLAQVPFRPNSLQAPPEQNWVALHGWPEEIHLPTCRDEIPEPRLTSDHPPLPRDLLYLSNKSVKPAAHHKSGALGSTPPPEDRLQKKKENHSGTMLPPPPNDLVRDQCHLSPVPRMKRTHRTPGQADLTDPAWGAGRTLASPQATW